MTQLQSDLAKEKSAKDAAATKSQELEKSLSAEKATHAAADERVATLERDVTDHERALADAREELQTTKTELTQANTQLTQAKAAGDSKSQELENVLNAVNGAEKLQKETERALADAREELQTTKTELTQAYTQLTQAKAAGDSKSQELENVLNAANEANTQLNKKLKEHSDRFWEASAKSEQLSKDLDNANPENDTLIEEHDFLLNKVKTVKTDL